ncbi:MAG: hypothetical protein K1X82_09130 [Bacteroidia bacterium]|nr:hypothetical protein [Bacteroidia bacterium]
MKKLLLIFSILLLTLNLKSQKLNIQVSLKDKTSFSGRLIEYKEGDYLVVEIAGNPIRINFNTIASLSPNSIKDSVSNKKQENPVESIRR